MNNQEYRETILSGSNMSMSMTMTITQHIVHTHHRDYLALKLHDTLDGPTAYWN